MQTRLQRTEKVPYYHYICLKCNKPVKTESAWYDNGQYHFNCLPVKQVANE